MSSLCSPALPTLYPTEVLPKHLILPKSSLNQCTTVLLRLPEPLGEECCFTTAVSSENHFHQADFCVHPAEGIIGGPNGTSSLALHFTPIEYCTLTYEVIVTLHSAEEKHVYVVKVAGSCFPHSESKENRRQAACFESLATDMSSKPTKTRSERQRKTTISRKSLQNSKDHSDGSKLLTPAGLLKFLSKKQPDSMSGLGFQNVRDMEQQRREFEKVQSSFLRELSAEESKEKALASDYRKVRIGQDAVGGESIRQVRLEFQEHSLAYETLKGRNLAELLKLTKPRYSYQRISQDLDASGENENYLKHENDPVSLSPKSAILKPFVQAAYKIMLRYRVDKRIPAVRSLVQSTRIKT